MEENKLRDHHFITYLKQTVLLVWSRELSFTTKS